VLRCAPTTAIATATTTTTAQPADRTINGQRTVRRPSEAGGSVDVADRLELSNRSHPSRVCCTTETTSSGRALVDRSGPLPRSRVALPQGTSWPASAAGPRASARTVVGLRPAGVVRAPVVRAPVAQGSVVRGRVVRVVGSGRCGGWVSARCSCRRARGGRATWSGV
jgi:hypothetical protein